MDDTVVSIYVMSTQWHCVTLVIVITGFPVYKNGGLHSSKCISNVEQTILNIAQRHTKTVCNVKLLMKVSCMFVLFFFFCVHYLKPFS